MSVDWVDILNREVEHLKESSRLLCEDNRRLRADNERLKTLVRTAECNGEADKCPWCTADMYLVSPHVPVEHAEDCPAFTPDGEVK